MHFGMGLLLLISSGVYIFSGEMIRVAVEDDEHASAAFKTNIFWRSIERDIAAVSL